MKFRRRIFIFACLIVSVSACSSQNSIESLAEESVAVIAVRNPIVGADPKDYLDKIILPDGFHIELYAQNVPGARSMALGDNGAVFVGTRGQRGDPDRKGGVFAVVDSDGDMRGETVIEIDNGLYMPNGVAVQGGNLYVAEPNRILRYDDIESNLNTLPEPVVVDESYPPDAHHGWKYIEFGPDGRLYVPVGAPCNICEPSDEYAVITSIKPDGSDKKTIARGIRNTVGFDWHPETGELWFTDNGRDLWGDDMPPDELNRLSADGQHFGFPYEYGKSDRDGEFALPKGEFVKAALELPPHSAPLGMAFYNGEMFPAEYRNQILIAHHGSWNRSQPSGYYISLVRLVDGEPQAHEVFASGWLQGNENWGRPVDILHLPDGSILVSDDQANCIYRISYKQ